MFIKKTTKHVKGKTYVNHLLVESIATKKGPRHRVICSLGSLEPAPREEWLALAHKMELALSGQQSFLRDEQVEEIVARVRGEQPASPGVGEDLSAGSAQAGKSELVSVYADQVEVEEAREAGPVHVGHQMWRKLGLDGILAEVGLSGRARVLTEVMTLNRLVFPRSEHAMPDWIRRTALSDLLGTSWAALSDDALYLNLDRLHPERAKIERALAERERTLFNLDDSIFLYDLTSTYFEGECLLNPQAKRGYSRDKRPDCKQVLVGLVLNGDGFPKAHEVFEGNRQDRATVEEMLLVLEGRTGKKGGALVVVDRGMAFAENLVQIRGRGYHYLVASRQGERMEHGEEFEDEAGWEEVIRRPSPRNPGQKKTRVTIKRKVVGEEVFVLCRSEGREEKDRAIRERQEKRLLADLSKLSRRVKKGRLRGVEKVHEAIGRLKERYPRVARYYRVSYDPAGPAVSFEEDAERKETARRLDGSYLLKTSCRELSAEQIWKIYIMLTRVESAFRAMKSPLAERPIFHHLKHRVQTHIFLCILAYHLLVSIEKMFLETGIHTSWETLREELSTHQVVTVALPASNGEILKIRKGTRPESRHKEIYEILRISGEIMKPVKSWEKGVIGTERNRNPLKSQEPW